VQIFKAVILPALGILIVILIVHFWRWKQPPCVLNIEEVPGEVLPQSPGVVVVDSKQTDAVNQISDTWKTFKPEVLLVKGKVGFYLPGVMDPVKKFGPAGKARELAAAGNIPVYSYNLPDEEIFEEVSKKYSRNDIEFSMLLSSYYDNIKESPGGTRKSVIRECINNSRCAGFNSTIRTPKDIDDIWVKNFKTKNNWRDTNGLPGIAGEIEKEIASIKRKHIYNVVVHFIKQNKKVFVVDSNNDFVNEK
jgi:hypothetical protein